MVVRAPGRGRLADGYCPGPVPNVVFVAPYLLEATLRFVEAAARLDGVRVALVGSEPDDAVPAALAGGLVTYVPVSTIASTPGNWQGASAKRAASWVRSTGR